MAQTGTPTTGDDIITITPTGFHSVDGLGGDDLLVVDYSSLSTNIFQQNDGFGWYSITDGFFSGVSHYGFERFNITGGSGDDRLFGRNSDDRLNGGAGNDILTSGLGSDTIIGGWGQDRWVGDYSSLTGPVNLTLKNDGTWSLISATSSRLINIEEITLTTSFGNDSIDTSAFIGNDTINSQDGNDTIASGRGIDSISGGNGDDLLIMDWSGITDPNADISLSSIGYGWQRYVPSGGSDRMDFYGFERFNLSGGSGNDSLRGGNSTDTLIGNAGDDRLFGGQGIDVIQGGAGLDTWHVDTSNLLAPVTVNLQTQTTNFGTTLSGIEQINYTGGVERDSVTALAGQFDDTINTGDNDDTVASGRGMDSISGGNGNDLLIMDWSAIAGPGQNISLSNIGYGWQRYSAATGDQLDFFGFERFDMAGGAGHDYLVGGGLDDTLVGNGGNDTLNGGAGLDVVQGGAGVDTWILDTTARAATTAVNLGANYTNTGASFSGVEQLHYTGGASIDYVTAQAGVFNDILNTGGGNDRVTTGRGRDVANGGDGTDTLVMDWSALVPSGPDAGNIVHSNEAYGWRRFATADGDQLDFYGFERFNLTGSSGDDQLIGGGDFDTLIGNAGDDTLNSGLGRGVIDGGSGTDLWHADLTNQGARLFFNAMDSQSTSQLTNVGLDVRNIEQVNISTAWGADRIDTSGYALNDVINTNDGNDWITPGHGFDTVNGGLGSDILFLDYDGFTSAVSTVGIGYGWNRYGDMDGTSSVDYYAIERFNIRGGAANDHLVGGTDSDTLLGGAGDDVLNGSSGDDRIFGNAGNDTFLGDYSTALNDLSLTINAWGSGVVNGIGTRFFSIENVGLSTGVGADMIDLSARNGNDTVNSGDGNDLVNLGAGTAEEANGGSGTDTLVASAALAQGGVSASSLGYGWTRLSDTAGTYQLDHYGFEKFDLTGSSFSDRLSGGGDNDTLSGGAGVDILEGGGGNDLLTGGADMDMFLFSSPAASGVDTITDFGTGDFVRVSGETLGGAITFGGGAALLEGEVQIWNTGGDTRVFIGTDSTAGYDLTFWLDGTYGIGDFSLSGSDMFFV